MLQDGYAGGALTIALAHTLREAFKNQTARSASIELTSECFHFAATSVIRQTWTENQKPRFEGNRHLLLFDNCVAPPCTEQALIVDEVSEDGKRVHVPAGLVHAMRPGVYNLVSYKAHEGTKATVRIHTVERPFDCDGELSPPDADANTLPAAVRSIVLSLVALLFGNAFFLTLVCLLGW